VNEGADDSELLFHAFGKRPDRAIPHVPEFQHLKEIFDLLPPLRVRALVQPPIKVEVPVRAQVLLETDVVWDEADDLPDLLAVCTVSDLIIGYPRLSACL